jgi:hypothetical protein
MNIEKTTEFELMVKKYRENITALEENITKTIDSDKALSVDCPLKHSYGDGLYVREIFMSAGTFIISKIHKFNHPYFVLTGMADVITEDGITRIKAPYYGMTKAGTKRALFIIENMIWVTVHATKEKSLEIIEDEIISKNYKDFDEFLNKDIIDADVIDENKHIVNNQEV